MELGAICKIYANPAIRNIIKKSCDSVCNAKHPTIKNANVLKKICNE